jgi:hypothetical protein
MVYVPVHVHVFATFRMNGAMARFVGTVNSEEMSAVQAANTVARELGILRTFTSPSSVTVRDIIQRIMDERESYTKRHASKAAKEAEYIESHKQFIPEA